MTEVLYDVQRGRRMAIEGFLGALTAYFIVSYGIS